MSRLKKHVRNYTQVGNDIVNDKNLSLKAKGLFLYLLSKPDDWDFSALKIGYQNKDEKASINSGLHELEDFGLLHRVPCQGGYDYEIFDTPQSHLAENRLSRKSVKRLPKIDLAENRSSISNKESLAKKKKEEEEINPISNFPFLFEFMQFCISSNPRIQNTFAYAESLKCALLDPKNKRHKLTLYAYNDFIDGEKFYLYAVPPPVGWRLTASDFQKIIGGLL